MNRLAKAASFLLPLCLAGAAPAMAATVEDFQTWGNITATGGLGFIDPQLQRFRYWLEGQGRFGDDTSVFSQGMVRPGLGYALSSRASIWLGYAWIPTGEPFTQKPFDEHRIWQQFLWTDRWSVGAFTSRSRLEQRFADSGDDVGWRFRQLFKLSWPIPMAPKFSLVGADEVFININKADWGPDHGLDQNRAFAGIGYNFDEHVKTEIGYMNQYIHKTNAPDRMDHILSVNLLLNY
jgi:hypothetical protein